MDSNTQSVDQGDAGQQRVRTDVGNVLSEMLRGGTSSTMGQVFQQLLTGGMTDIRGVEQSAVRQWQRDIIPGINASASGISAMQNSKRGELVIRSGEDLSLRLANIRAQMTESYRNRQLQSLGLPLGHGTNLGTASTQDTIAEPSMFSQFMQLGGAVGGAAAGGK